MFKVYIFFKCGLAIFFLKNPKLHGQGSALEDFQKIATFSGNVFLKTP
jgi:hypothetical protein